MGVRVWDRGESEGRSVMDWIGIQLWSNVSYPARKGADFRVVSHHERVCRTFEGGEANERQPLNVCVLR